MRLLIVENDPRVPPGHLVRVAADRAHDITIENAAAGNLGGGTFDAVVVLGGEMGAYDTDEYPWLEDEKAFLRSLVSDGVPVLGVCLGCQLLADALGGRAYRAPVPEARFAPIMMRTPDATVAELAAGPVLMLHEDTWDPPPGATVIAESPSYLQAFRLGSALGVQCHPELTPAIVADWFSSEDVARHIEEAGADPASLRTEVEAGADQIAETGERFFGAWLDESAPPTGG